MTARVESERSTTAGSTSMDRVSPLPRWARSRLVLAVIALALAGAMAAAATLTLFVFPPTGVPSRADAIVVLGGTPEQQRVDEGMRLLAAHVAPVVAISNLPQFVQACRNTTDPRTAICFAPDPQTTQGEAREVRVLAREHGWRSIVVVSSRFQATRARLRIRRCFSGSVTMDAVTPPRHLWPYDVAYEWGATLKAVFVQRGC